MNAATTSAQFSLSIFIENLKKCLLYFDVQNPLSENEVRQIATKNHEVKNDYVFKSRKQQRYDFHYKLFCNKIIDTIVFEYNLSVIKFKKLVESALPELCDAMDEVTNQFALEY